tara:strand:+ start:2074 stop:2553 length:480 start_codon:yes stop_codon:yes gene_type:complete
MFSQASKLTWLIRLFGFTKVAMIFFCRPKVIHVSEDSLEIKIPLNRKTRNHVKSMYLGTLSVGADITGGFLAMPHIRKSKRKIVLLFKDFSAKFLKRAEGDVHFICNEGKAVKELVKNAIKTGERQNHTLKIYAKVPKKSSDIVAEFDLTISIKDYTRN